MIRAIALVAVGLFAFLPCDASADRSVRLSIDWPLRWEYRVPERINGVWYLTARRDSDPSPQCLHLAIVPTTPRSAALPLEAVKSLVIDLASISKSAVRALPSQAGYYFVARNESRLADAAYSIEGVLLRDGYLVRLALHTDDPHSVDAASILAAVATARIR